MEKIKRNLNLAVSIIVLSFYAFAAIASASANDTYSKWNGSAGQQAVQHVVQSQNGGTYLGNFSSEQAAKQAAIKAGYSRYGYYPSTGEAFGYN